MTYQTHTLDAKGMTDSHHRLTRLMVPADLTGKSVLDIGCNEGFYCKVAADRGATRVVGIDSSASALATARELYGHIPQIEFREQGWQRLPEGPFDLVFWTSAMHYELDPLFVLRQVADRLTPTGILILECGVNLTSGLEMTRVQRHDGALWYPTLRFFEEHLLAGFAFRRVADPEQTGTDPILRSVYHAQRRLPEVMLFRGETGSGKSAAAAALAHAATKTMSLDMFLFRIMASKHQHSALEKHVFSIARPTNLTEVYRSIDDAGLTDEYARELAKGVAATDTLVVIDGYMTDSQVAAFRQAMKNRAKIWEAVEPQP